MVFQDKFCIFSINEGNCPVPDRKFHIRTRQQSTSPESYPQRCFVPPLPSISFSPPPITLRGSLSVSPKNNDWNRGSAELVRQFDYRGVHIGARALLVIYLIWFGYFARPPVGRRRGYFTRSNFFYLPSRCLRERLGKGVSTLCFSPYLCAGRVEVSSSTPTSLLVQIIYTCLRGA